MADYYPLISRAVAGLEKNNGENRRALYERARAALIAQLRGVHAGAAEFGHHARAARARRIDPQGRGGSGAPIRRADRGSTPTPTARRRSETRRPAESPMTPPALRTERRTPRNPARADPAWRSRAPWQPAAPDVRRRPAAASAAAARRQGATSQRRAAAIVCRRAACRGPRAADSIFDQPLPPEPPPPPPPPATAAPSVAPADGGSRPRAEPACKDIRNVVTEANELGGASARAAQSARDAYAAVPRRCGSRSSQRSQDRPQLDRPQSTTRATIPSRGCSSRSAAAAHARAAGMPRRTTISRSRCSSRRSRTTRQRPPLPRARPPQPIARTRTRAQAAGRCGRAAPIAS